MAETLLMILIGQYDSPFVRRVGIALALHGVAFEHRPWSVFGDAALVREINPLGRVPVLVLEDGMALPGSDAILDFLDSQAGAGALVPPTGWERAVALRRTALALGIAEKSVSLVYERRFHRAPSAALIARMEGQIAATLAVLEDECASAAPFWFGVRPGHADVMLGCAIRFLAAAHPGLACPPAVAAHAARCEALEVFARIQQAFSPP